MPMVSLSALCPKLDIWLSISAVLGKVAGVTKSRLIGVEEKTIELPVKDTAENSEKARQPAATMRIEKEKQ
jgi:hypothetical protein